MKLFLDDIREPRECTWIKDSVYQEGGWVIVRTFEDFKECVRALSNFPEVISFDHDLGDTEGTGYDCAKWLIGYCEYLHVKLPPYLCHSMNPVGKENIIKLLGAFKDKQNS